jgi:hypothetical protein
MRDPEYRLSPQDYATIDGCRESHLETRAALGYDDDVLVEEPAGRRGR